MTENGEREHDAAVEAEAPPMRLKRTRSPAQLAALEKARAARATRKSAPPADAVPANGNGDRGALEQIAARHARRPTEIDEDEELDDQDDSEPESYPSIAEIAERTELTAGGDIIPPSEQQAEHENVPTFETPDLAGYDYTPRSLDDLMSIATLGDGQHYITVERTDPRKWQGLDCAGVQPRIDQYTTADKFIRMFGGGRYVLMLYGPPKRGGMYDPLTKKVIPKPLTGPVKYTVPIACGNPVVYTLSADDEETEDENPMRYSTSAFTAVTPKTPADARIHETNLQYDEKQQDRRERLEKENREKMEATLKEAEQKGITIAQLMQNNAREQLERQEERHEHELERQRDQWEARLKMLEERLRENANRETPMEGFVKLASVMKPNENGASKHVEARVETLQNQLTQMGESHKHDILRMQEAHKAEMERTLARGAEVQNNTERRVQDAEMRAEKRVQDIEAKCEARIRDIEERGERRVREAEERSQRTVVDVERQMTARLEDERRNHDRDLKSQAATYDTRIETLKATGDTRISAKDEEIARVRAEAERAHRDAEKNKDIFKRVSEIKETAQMLGMEEAQSGGNEPGDWKQMLMGIGIELAKGLPATIEKAGETYRGIKNPVNPAQQAAIQAHYQNAMYADAGQTAPRGLPPRPGQRRAALQQPMAFASEDGPDFVAPMMVGGNVAPPRYPQGFDETGMRGQPPQPPPGQVEQPPAAMQPTTPPQQAMVAPAPQQQAAPHPHVQQQQAVHQAQQAQRQQGQQTAGPAIDPAEVMKYRPALENAFASGETPDQIAEQIIQQLGPQMALQLVQSIPPNRLLAAIQQTPGGAQSPLVRREGQKFIKQLWDAVRQRAGA